MLDDREHMSVLRAMSYEDMAYMIHGAANGGSSGARSEGAGWEGNRQEEGHPGPGYGGPDDDDIPF